MRKTIFLFLPLVSIMLLVGGCFTPKPEKTQLEIREFQTRSYDTTDFKMVMKAVMDALQDEAFIIKQADLDLGFISAQKELDVTSGGEVFVSRFLAVFGGSGRYRKNSITEASGNISQFGDQIRVRVNFQNKIIDNQGKIVEIQQIDDQNFYQEFFSKVDKSIFIAKEEV